MQYIPASVGMTILNTRIPADPLRYLPRPYLPTAGVDSGLRRE